MGIPQKVVLTIVNILPFIHAPLVSQNRPNRYRFYFDDVTLMLQLHPGLIASWRDRVIPQKLDPTKALQAFIKLGFRVMTLISPWYCWRFRNQTVEGKVVYLLFTRFQHHSRWWSPGFLNHQRCWWFPGRLTTVYACVSSRRGWDTGKLILQNHMAVFGEEALKSSSFKLMFTSNGSDERNLVHVVILVTITKPC